MTVEARHQQNAATTFHIDKGAPKYHACLYAPEKIRTSLGGGNAFLLYWQARNGGGGLFIRCVEAFAIMTDFAFTEGVQWICLGRLGFMEKLEAEHEVRVFYYALESGLGIGKPRAP